MRSASPSSKAQQDGPLQPRYKRRGRAIDVAISLGYHPCPAQVPNTDPDDHLRITEALVQAAWQRQDFKTAATLVLESYGTELYSFVLAQFHHSWDEAEDAFSMFREDLWRGLPSFQWRCSVRAWSYQLARHAISRYRRSPQNRRARHVSLEDSDFLNDAIERARTTTQVHLRSEIKTEIQKLRNELTQEERDLLALRIDRNLPWREVAHAMLPDGETSDEQRVRRLESSLRQRFVELKKRLKQLAIERGIL